MAKAEVAVVGGGIIGLAHAWLAARRGWSVVLFERHEFAQGASIRNFGMIWPIGQPAGERLQLALRSRAIWSDVVEETGIQVASTGSVHLAYRDDEAAVIHEFAEAGPRHGYRCRLMNAEQVRAATPGVRTAGLL